MAINDTSKDFSIHKSGVGDWITLSNATGNVLLNPLSGNVGIGTIAPSSKLEVCGDVKVVGQIIANSSNLTAGVSCSSDIRFKKNIRTMNNALSNVLSLRGVNYDWKIKEFPEKNFSEGTQIGFIAQELEKVFPEVVFTDKDGYKSVDYSRLTPVLLEAIKEQQKLIEKQKLENENRKTEIEKQQKDIDLLKEQLQEIRTEKKK